MYNNIKEIMGDNHLEQKIVFSQDSDYQSHFNNNVYSYLFTDDFFGTRTAVAESSSSHADALLRDHLSELVSPFVSLKSDIDIDTGIMPPGVRYVGKNYVVFERPPTFQNVFYVPSRVEDMYEEYNGDDGEEYREDDRNYYDPQDNQIAYRLPIPWQLYIATFDANYLCATVHMFFMNTSLFSTDQILWAPTIPNFYSNALLCRPMFDNMEEIDRYEKNVKGVIETAYDWVWNNGTNNDLNETLVQLCIQQPEHPIMNAIPEQIKYRFSSNSLYNRHYFESDKVCNFFAAWETLSIPDILNHPWPNPSSGTHFGYVNNQPQMPDNYNELLYQWISDGYYDATENNLSSEEIEEIIDNEDYSHSDFVQHLTDSGLMITVAHEWETSYTYKEILNKIIKNIPYNSKNDSLSKDITLISHSISEARGS
jgi:hypothetical protein